MAPPSLSSAVAALGCPSSLFGHPRCPPIVRRSRSSVVAPDRSPPSSSVFCRRHPSFAVVVHRPSTAIFVRLLPSSGKKTIKETYQKKTQLEHILLHPDTYIGSVEKHSQTLWVYEGGEMVHRPVSYVPGLYKIFDEILVNVADNKQHDPSMDSVKVEIDSACRISVYNNDNDVPIEIHKEEGVYMPNMIFDHLLTSSNYDDNVKKTTGGHNGYGAKLTNIFSTEFVIETADGRKRQKYKQLGSLYRSGAK